MAFHGSGTLIIKPLNAKLTRDTEFMGKMDPYCCVRVGPTQNKTKVHNDAGKHPSWNDVLTFRRTNEHYFEVFVWDKDTVSNDDLIGQASIPLQPLMDKSTSTEWFDLVYKGKKAGQILIEVKWIVDSQQVSYGNQYNPQVIPMQISQRPNPVTNTPPYPGQQPGYPYPNQPYQQPIYQPPQQTGFPNYGQPQQPQYPYNPQQPQYPAPNYPTPNYPAPQQPYYPPQQPGQAPQNFNQPAQQPYYPAQTLAPQPPTQQPQYPAQPPAQGPPQQAQQPQYQSYGQTYTPPQPQGYPQQNPYTPPVPQNPGPPQQFGQTYSQPQQQQYGQPNFNNTTTQPQLQNFNYPPP